MKVYTKEGDSGTSALFGSTKRMPKSSTVFEILGLADEVNATLGCALAFLKRPSETALLTSIQEDIFLIGAYIAGLKFSSADKAVWTKRVTDLEDRIDAYSAKLPILKVFILPGGSEASSHIHLARVKVRALERDLVSYSRKKSLKFLLPYINRLSDLLFVLARYVNMELGKKEEIWKKK
ncbi:MAG: ATP/cobalamin adenosyltransferase [uncultured bacterium]|uniref:Corrinoid adenosyltransferase n=1 Tax=candidate division WWE3 bacterium TaxID=2053526 RepID=A0A656PL25_UNCKA|nr:ATP:cob(I)alamin adenosyltransferase [candidate division WWE3 bacterium RAAC2_WWE3_1]EKD95175.1 MAG: ATP/cobalamin adenosyltransferase [uncultured bacterium]KKS29846.1 MAG: ATP:cob(I)alamin adenosyltransferase [candidate division WWE3 bacterium GW2011_GWB1_42_117]KKS55271.1 MAG: ATP:cob(I)alamin adenosyltransferase [candidate division WWE3 bacterium GW2011_GWD2_42_34]KKT05824.1 MAG: ATP:cob(I)alamin adenosyltransferase [candidate division WWE3 bacterium GW2011_GWE2_43_18]KKT07286.1 MAG: ATP